MTPPRRTLFRLLTAAALTLATAWLLPGVARAQPASAPPVLGDGSIVLIRHADAPGIGDPPGFRLGNCSTQRNLNDAGRAQARGIGEGLRAQGLQVGQVRSSQWCRTLDTATLAFPEQQVLGDADFNSFFENRADDAAQTARALATLRRWNGPGTLVVVTHQVNITALTGAFLAMGDAVVVRVAAPNTPDAPRGLQVLGRLRP